MFRGILCEDPKYPKNHQYSEEVIDFIDSLLQKNPVNRLGFEDEQDIFSHPWYKDIDFSVLMSKKVTKELICLDACDDYPEY
jgi:serine/threonine protein kinase